jgi:hypothetical protein
MGLGALTNNIMKGEPVAVINGATAIIEASIALAVGFGLDWDAKQVSLVMATVMAVGNLSKTLWSRGKVTPVKQPRDNDRNKLVSEKQVGSIPKP